MAKKKVAVQPRLPEMADAKLEALHDAALKYAAIRDERQALTADEVELKGKLLDLMHKYKKTTYEYKGVTVTLVTESETVKVKVKKETEDAAVDVKVSDATSFDPGEIEAEEEAEPVH